MENYINIAEKANLTFIRRAEVGEVTAKSNRDYSLFKFNTCGHEQFMCNSKVKKGITFCWTCSVNKADAYTKNAGLTFLRKINDFSDKKYAEINRYSFNACGHEQNIQRSRVKTGQFVCQTCIELNYDKVAESQGLTMIRNDEITGELLPFKFGSRLYLFNNCGHKKSIKIDDVRSGRFMCNECQAVKIENEASNANLTYLRKATIDDMSTEIKNHGFFRFNDCGHEQALSKTAVRTGQFKCNTCNVSSKFKPSSVYLYKIETQYFSWLKLGFSSNPEFRGKKYNIATEYNSTLLSLIEFSTGEAANKFERSLHNLFKSYRLDAGYMKKYMKCSGFTECYPVDLELQLLSELNKFKENNG